MAIPKTILKDGRIQEISDERGGGDGIWVYLKPGFINIESETHMIHEDSWKEVIAMRGFIKPCTCEDCQKP